MVYIICKNRVLRYLNLKSCHQISLLFFGDNFGDSVTKIVKTFGDAVGDKKFVVN